MTIQADDILRVAVEYALPNSTQALNVFYFLVREFTGANEDAVQDFADFVEDQWHVHWKDIASADASIVGVALDTLNVNGTVKENIGSATLDLVGVVGGEISASAVSGYIKANTNVPKARGSKYVPGMTENHCANSVWNATATAKLTALLTEYILEYVNPATGNTYLPGVLSRVLLEFVAFNETGDLTDVPAYQRRRKAGVGS